MGRMCACSVLLQLSNQNFMPTAFYLLIFTRLACLDRWIHLVFTEECMTCSQLVGEIKKVCSLLELEALLWPSLHRAELSTAVAHIQLYMEAWDCFCTDIDHQRYIKTRGFFILHCCASPLHSLNFTFQSELTKTHTETSLSWYE